MPHPLRAVAALLCAALLPELPTTAAFTLLVDVREARLTGGADSLQAEIAISGTATATAPLCTDCTAGQGAGCVWRSRAGLTEGIAIATSAPGNATASPFALRVSSGCGEPATSGAANTTALCDVPVTAFPAYTTWVTLRCTATLAAPPASTAASVSYRAMLLPSGADVSASALLQYADANTSDPSPSCGPFCTADADCCSGSCQEGVCGAEGSSDDTALRIAIICVCMTVVIGVSCGVGYVMRKRRLRREAEIGQNEPLSITKPKPKPRVRLAALSIGFGDIACPAPARMTCPISLQLMRDPVSCVCESQHTFERACLEAALQARQECPLSRLPLAQDEIVPNDALREEIEKHVEVWRSEQAASASTDASTSSGAEASTEDAEEEEQGVVVVVRTEEDVEQEAGAEARVATAASRPDEEGGDALEQV